MDIILPYDEKLRESNGAFIQPDGKILYTPNGHEYFAKNFCQGEVYDFLLHQKCKGEKEVDEYASTNLTKENLQFYKMWIQQNARSSNCINSDFLMFVLGFDKVEMVVNRAIITTNPLPHLRFYNYYLMDWDVEQKDFQNFHSQFNQFRYAVNGDWTTNYNKDRAIEKEINEIKAKVKKRDRYLFFK